MARIYKVSKPAITVDRIYTREDPYPTPENTMRFSLALISTLLAAGAAASPFSSESKLVERENENPIQYLGSQSSTLSGGTKYGDLVFVSGQVPLLNGTVVPGGIKNETAFVIERVGQILTEGGTDWSKVLKVTVLLQGTLLFLRRARDLAHN